MEYGEKEPRARRGRGNSGDALASFSHGFRSGASGFTSGLTHFHTSVGSRTTGQSAAAKLDYINRAGKYEKGREKADYMESDNLPEWAKDQPREYWEAADKHERENGRLFVNSEFALPRELDKQQQIALAREQVQSMARTKDGQPLPYSFAIHDANGKNPHFHVIISERALDGKARTPETWFKRHPIGALKTRDLKDPEWVMDTRKDWCERANKHLALIGSQSRLDHRTLKEQGIDRVPTVHVGYTDPKRPHIRKARQEANEGIREANKAPEARKTLAQAEKKLAALQNTLREIEARAEAEKAAVLVKAQEQRPATPRQAHDQAQHDQAKHQAQSQAPARSSEQAEIHAPERARIPAEDARARRHEDAGGLGATPPVQRGEPSGAAVQQGAALPHHGQDLKAQEQQRPEPKQQREMYGLRPEQFEKQEARAWPEMAQAYERLKADAKQPAPTFDSVLAKQPHVQEAKTRDKATRDNYVNRLRAHRDREEALRAADKRQTEAEKYLVAARKQAGIFDFERKKELKEEAKKVEQWGVKLSKGWKEFKAESVELERLKAEEIKIGRECERTIWKERAPESATNKQLAQELAEHREKTSNAARTVAHYGPYMAARKEREEGKAKEQGKELSNQQKAHAEGLKPEERKLQMLTPQQQRVLDRELAKKREREGRGRGR